MSRDEIVALLTRHLEHLARRDPAALASDYTEFATVSSPMFQRVSGRDAIQRSFVSLFDTFPDWEMQFEPPLIDGTRAMTYCTVRASHMGAFMGVAGTGRRFEFTCVLAFDLENGLIARERRIYDFTGMLIQLGVLRGKPAI